MNYTTAILLIDRSIRTVAVSYEIDANGKGKAPFTTVKTIDPTIKVGDYAVMPTDTRHNFTVVRVEEVDVSIDYDSMAPMKWLADKVDRTSYDAILTRENEIIASIRSAEENSKREELAKKLLADNPALQGISITRDAALPAPEAPAPSPMGDNPF